ncbi:PREDICTED: SNF2 domain-containing protein CLASSY 3-like [Ipomoea nil]|uniref:SNF2 domain-containing protein CLASSY 3-like n=1 Tax=Ipomoea nil TaxID=35883 RepID=UPI000900D1D2|nr:PREDICTED: SNF2 domain-containing protein CLASSY 3-like [Ipomoea nil]
MNPLNAYGRRRPKTRNQWDDFYVEFNEEKKRKNNKVFESGSSSDRVEGDGGERGRPGNNAGGADRVEEEEVVVGKKRKRLRRIGEAQKPSSSDMDIEFLGDFVIGEGGKEMEMMDVEFVEKSEKKKEKGKEKEKGQEKEKEKEKEKEEDKSKWLVLVDKNSDTKCVAVVDCDDSSSDEDVVFVGETTPFYQNITNSVKAISVDDKRGDNNQLVLVRVSNQSPNEFVLKTGSGSGSKVGSVDGRGPEPITYDEVASSTSKRRRVESSISLSNVNSSDSEDFSLSLSSSSSSSSSSDDDSDYGDFIANAPSPVFKRADEKGKDGEKRKMIVSGLRSSSNKDERKEQSDYGFRVGEDSEEKQKTIAKKRRQRARNLNVKDILLNTVLEKESMLNERLRPEETAPPLPLKFRFEDEDEIPPEKEDWEVENESLFADLDMGRLQSETGSNAQTMLQEDNGKADNNAKVCCHPKGHLFILDEQIGILCKYCLAVFMEIKYIHPDFAVKSNQRYDKRFQGGLEHPDDDGDFELGDVPANNCAEDVSGETVWDLVPGHIKERMYQHQIDGFEFMWRNIAGDLDIQNLKVLQSNKGKGCIISHAPGTGKTGLSVVFLQSFMKLFPMCRPVVIAPRSMLLTWENEFVKWDVDTPFHNLNNPKLSGKENVTDDVQGSNWKIFKRKSKGRELNRTLKLYSWANGSGILGITYRLFEKLAGEGAEDEKVRRILLKYPGILVLDEGHTPRNDDSLMWRALSKVETPLRVILSGTPFQNNFQELYNTLCLVSPDFSVSTPSSTRNFMQKGKRNKWSSITSSIINDENGRRIDELKQMISPFVHVHKGHILLEKLPGLKDALVHLRLTDLQQKLLDLVSKKNFIEQDNLMTLISVHPSLAPDYIRGEKDLELDPSAGVKTNFVFELVKLCSAHGERVIVFSRLIEPLSLIKQQLLHHLKWSENEEILYMDGKIDAKYRQDRISAFNNPVSVAKVLLASTASCCEGINLIGASRIVLLDVVWNPSITRQAISRAYRLGQTKVVYVYNLISSTFEARKYECQARKDRMSELVFSDREGENHCSRTENLSADVILEAMAEKEKLRGIFELIVHQPRTQQILFNDPTEGPKPADQS